MPIYEYRRPDGTTFEIQQSFSDDTLTHDPDTGVPVQRVLHAPAVHFKGSGFYNTDYGTRKRQRENAAASSEESSAKKDSSDGGAGSGSDKGSDKGSSGGSGSSGSGGDAKGEKSSSGTGGKAKDTKPVAAKT
ncbi:MAG: FmdB family zinc ribbon protein [Solirubrobacteraceae bacterium]|jgi:putative FmdB family regulatory protein